VSARRVAHALAAATLAGSGAYLFVYLYRWEWNRALIAGVFVLASEVGLVAAALAARLRAIEALLPAEPAARARVAEQLRATAPPLPDHFAWLRATTTRTSVFVPVLLGAGVLLSALAWVVERVARATAGAALQRGLAGRIALLGPPPGSLLDAPGGDVPPAARILLSPSPAKRP
jgi:hypothetical protein